jgi:predicted ABC-class ATPase
LLLFDEDLCATNFMIRDDVMRKLVKLEPITPLIERVPPKIEGMLMQIRGLHFSQGVSSILVVGGCSDYLIADLVIMMENYRAKYVPVCEIMLTSRDVTAEAHALLSQTVHHLQAKDIAFPPAPSRTIIPQSLCDRSDRPPKPRSLTIIQLSRSGPDLELDALSQLVHSSQTRLIAQAIYFLTTIGKGRAMKEMVNEVIGDWEESMLNGDGGEEGWLAAVRGVDLGMAINRIRGLKVA